MIQNTGSTCPKCTQPLSAAYAGTAPVAGASPAKVRGIRPGIKYGGFWLRFMAFWIDAFILSSASAFIGVTIGLASFALGFDLKHADLFKLALNLAGYTGVILYEVLMTSSAWQGTVGKRNMGLVVVDKNGSRLSTGRAIARLLGKVFSAITFGFGYWMIGLTKYKCGLHDLLAGTRVIDIKSSRR